LSNASRVGRTRFLPTTFNQKYKKESKWKIPFAFFFYAYLCGKKPQNMNDTIDISLLWAELMAEMQTNFGKVPDLQTMLFLIGVQELGQLRQDFNKEEKQDLMHIAVCHLLSLQDHFHFIGRDEDGWPHYEPTATLKEAEWKGLFQQEILLKELILQYFEKI